MQAARGGDERRFPSLLLVASGDSGCNGGKAGQVRSVRSLRELHRSRRAYGKADTYLTRFCVNT